jgi:shikimate dehydrogenase
MSGLFIAWLLTFIRKYDLPFMPPVYGLIGYPLTHSFSLAYFRKKFEAGNIDAIYSAFELISINELPELISSVPNLAGLNVTIPYKTAVIPFLDELSDEAKAIGAVNCIGIHAGKLTGHNTDASAFEQSLRPLLKTTDVSAIILGTGGAALAVKYALHRIGISFVEVSRTGSYPAISYDDLTLELVEAHHLVINTTPVGMFPDTEAASPVPYEAVGVDHILYDLIYNPEETRFLKLGKARGSTVKNGYEMLVLQAEASWKIWNKV